MSDLSDSAGLWEHKVRFDAARKGLQVTLTADDDRRRLIAENFGMISLDALTAIVTTGETKGLKPLVHVHVELKGDVTQECGVTLDPFSHGISGVLDLDCIQAADARDEVAEISESELRLDDLDDPDVIEGGHIDLGLYVIEALGDAYDPFARKPGAVFEDIIAEPEPSPFAALANLKRES
jgi:uncharacterized metal-binding protein YceD (DUF177 family)